jgi:hypothetical protein
MVKKIFLIIILITLISCNFYKNLHTKNKCGRYRVVCRIKNTSFKFYNELDTSSVYKYDGEISKNSKNELVYLKNRYNNYYKFYANGKVGYFGLDDNETLSINKMNPCNFLNAYYGIDDNKNLILKRYVVTDLNGEYTLNCLIKFKNDTFEVTDIEFLKQGYKKIYIKEKIPKEWLVYKPDW